LQGCKIVNMKALILIGGIGTRLRPLTCSTPKPLLPIVNKPFLEYQFELLKKHGITDIILCISYLSNAFEEYFGTGKKWGVKIHYVHEKEPLGTGGAIRNANHIVDDNLLVLNGDILTDIDLKEFMHYHLANKACVTIALTRVKDPTAFGLIELNKSGKINRFLEKPSWDEVTCNTINAGIYMLSKEAINQIPEGINYSVERGLFPTLLAKNKRVFGYSKAYYWMDIGAIDKYLQAHADVMTHIIKVPINEKQQSAKFYIGNKCKTGEHIQIDGILVCGSNSKIDDATTFVGNVCLGNNVSVGKGTYIRDSVILDNTQIAEGVRIEQSVIGKNCLVEANSIVSSGTVLGDRTTVRKYSRL